MDDLKDAKISLDGCKVSSCRALLTKDFRDLKREYNDRELCNMVSTLEQTMTQPIQRVQKAIGVLLWMHRGRKAA